MEPAQSDTNILSNGKSHDLGDDVGVPMKTVPEEDQWVFFLCYITAELLPIVSYIVFYWYMSPRPGLFQAYELTSQKQNSLDWPAWTFGPQFPINHDQHNRLN